SRLGKIPILVGGTGLYLRALSYGLFKADTDHGLRMRLQQEYADNPLQMYDRLKDIDHEYALKISYRDKVRVVRATEVFMLTGKKFSELEKDHGFREPRYDILKIGLKREKQELYKRIDERVLAMFDQGWIEEVKHILSVGVADSARPFTGIGYREILMYLKGSIKYGDMVKDIQKQTRHYAKRQFTWFAKEKDMSWHMYPEDFEAISKEISRFLRNGTKTDH
ncbi:MAG TPA: tRNA (adenosine(37)-N6)-dimethylallyltransferase MiaA, partial [Syntrophorhabdaceae bacterium]|nr:tRNA (adenosine(37)-N6)-dimethylallyltransferase MiaA [Syntrophorhabdaceae bacterium]